MIDIQNTKTCILLPPELKNNGDFAGNTYLDTAGWGHLRVEFITGTGDTTVGSTAEGTAPLVEQCDTTDGSYTAVTDAALADSISALEDDKLFAIDIDITKSHKRYMRVQAPHAGAGTTGNNLAIIGILSKPIGQGPGSAADQGLTEHIVA